MNSLDGRFIIAGNRIETKEKVKVENPATLEPIGEACLGLPSRLQESCRSSERGFPPMESSPSP